MKTPEERHTAWLDDALTPEERATFEADAGSLEEARREKQFVERLRTDLRAFSVAPEMESPDFFTHGVMERIAKSEAAGEKRETTAGAWWSLGRLAWLGAGAVAASVVLTASMIPRGGEHAPIDYSAEVIETQVPAEAGGISAVAFRSEESELTVLWLDGLDYVPDSHAIN